jgi:hypothetical protein
MDANRFLSLLPKIDVVAISKDSLFIAQQLVTGCEACDPNASVSFSTVLGEVTKRTDSVTDYIVCEPAKCGKCGAAIVETTLVALNAPNSTFTSNGFDTLTEHTDVLLIDEPRLREAEEWISSCEQCSSQTAQYSFDQILDSLTGSDPTKTEYLLCREAICPRCHSRITEKTLISAA